MGHPVLLQVNNKVFFYFTHFDFLFEGYVLDIFEIVKVIIIPIPWESYDEYQQRRVGTCNHSRNLTMIDVEKRWDETFCCSLQPSSCVSTESN